VLGAGSQLKVGVELGEERYILSAERDREAESLQYLRIQESVVDHVTIRHLETIGVTEGWKCLEIGAGAGSIAEWLSKRVGHTGRVVATDIDTRFLQVMTAPNITVRQHNILKDDLEKAEYHLVHCRKLLHHLPEPERPMRLMVDALRPGGWLLVEEDDWGSMMSGDITDPSATPFVAGVRAFYDSLRKRGLVDYYFGRRVRGLVEGLGLEDVTQDGWTVMLRSSDPLSHMHEAAFQRIEKSMIAEGILTQEQSEAIQHGFMDPSLYIPWYTLFCAWGRKPVQEGGG
jgi:SAM-dependent methyltransferase